MAAQTDRNTKPITSSDTINVLINTVMPAIEEIKGDMKVINNRLQNIECDTKDVNEVIKMFRVTLYGNGNPDKGGLVTIVAKLQEWIDSRTYYERVVIGILAAETVGVGFLFARVFLGL
jgi:hypothetical protein